MSERPTPVYEFGSFRMDPQEQVLLKGGSRVDLTPKMFELLLLLVKNGGHLLEREQLMREVWPDAVVDENNLSQGIYVLRRVLGNGDDPGGASFIETVPRRGYRFVAPVQVVPGEPEVEKSVPTMRANGADEISSVDVRTQTGRQGWTRAAVWGGALFLVVAMLLLIRQSRVDPSVSSASAAQSVAVLPFQLLNASGEDEYLSLGLADAIITKLSETRGLIVRPIDAVRNYSRNDVDVMKAGRDLKVGALLVGTVQRDGDKVRVGMRLLDARNGTALWADQVDCNFTDVFAIEDQATYEVERALIPGSAPHTVTSTGGLSAKDAAARQDYMKGRFFWSKRTGEGFRTAIEFFQHAIERDPNYAEAYAGIADSYALLGFYDYLLAAESYPKAKEAALHALAINNNLAEAHISLLGIATDYDWDWEAAEREYRAAIALNPNDAAAYQYHAYVLLALGQPEGAARDAEKALQLDPLSPGVNSSLAWAYYLGHDYSRSLQQCKRTRELYPDFVVARQVSALDYAQLGEGRMATAELQEAQRIAPDNPITGLLQAHALATWGHREESQRQLEHVLRVQKSVSPYYVAAVYSTLGRADEALAWLDKAYGARSNWVIFLTLDPRFDPVRKDARFSSLLQKVGVPELKTSNLSAAAR